ncbi:LEM-3-like GIY-YIG domain-containing protein [Blastococcus sp. SYSU D00669]
MPNLNGFSSIVEERIGWYVYLLRDPRDDEVFYIGKGRGSRAFQHAKQAADDDDTEATRQAKLERLRDITAAGCTVRVEILRHNIATESAAFDIEAAAIDLFRATGRQLTNIMGGHHSGTRGWGAADVVASIYDAEPAPDIDVPLLLVKVPRLWQPSRSAGELYEVTRGWWALGEKKGPRARFAATVSKGVIRAAYRIESWRERVPGDRDWQRDVGKKPRLGFIGAPAPELEQLLNRSVKHLFKPGQASPVTYLNCADPELSRAPVLRGEDARRRPRRRASPCSDV